MIGEMVMDNLLDTDKDVEKKLLDDPMKRTGVESIRCYLCCFSLGGGTGCGASSALIGRVIKAADQHHRNVFTAGVVILPNLEKAKRNYYISAGRFLLKFLATKQHERIEKVNAPVIFDTAITVSNSIISRIAQDRKEAEAKINTFAANVIISMVNSSSRFIRSTRNPDAPELKKNLNQLAFFCYSQLDPKEVTGYQKIISLFERAISPVEKNCGADAKSSGNTFEGRPAFNRPEALPHDPYGVSS